MRKFIHCLAIAVMLGVGWLGKALTVASDLEFKAPAWSNPSITITKQVNSTGNTHNRPVFLENLDCSPLTYRLVTGSTMQTGCFTETAFGLFDSDSSIAIFNGSDEGLPVLAYAPRQVLAPWPGTDSLIALSAVGTGGSYISLYKNALGVMQDQRDYSLRLTAKQLTAAPELQLKDSNGQRLIINPQTIAFTSGGTWVVMETLSGSFVRINLNTLEAMPFAAAYFHPGSPALLKSRVAISPDGRFVAIANDPDKSLKVFDLSNCTDRCPFFNYRPFIESRITGLQSIRHIRFVNKGILSFEAYIDDGENSGTYLLAPAASLDSLTDYIGLGDSYTSGEGAFDYVAGTDSPNNMCHLSAHSYPLLLARDLYGKSGGHSIACSGAVINDVGSTSDDYQGQIKDGPRFKQLQQNQPTLLNSVMANFTPGYVAQHRFVRQYQPKVVTVSVGGNDIGFGDLIEICVQPHLSRHLSDNTCFNTYEDRLELINLIERTIPKWEALYKRLLAASPGTRLYAVGYPQIVDDKGSCGLNVHLNQSEREFAIELINYLNDAISKAAAKAGVIYLDISQALYGHRLCETAAYNVAMNGLTAGRDGGILGLKVLGKESYHPNSLGQLLIERAILRTSHNLTAGQPTNPPAERTKLLGVPKTGRQITNRVPANLTPRVIKKGQTIAIQFKGVSAGLKPKSTYSVRLDGPSGRFIGNITTDDKGDIEGLVGIPADTDTGGHTIGIDGTNQVGEPLYVIQPIYVPADDNDGDGDGIVNNQDSCPGVESGTDSDDDDIDDVCDPLIRQPSDGTGQVNAGSASGSLATFDSNTSMTTSSVKKTGAKTENYPTEFGNVHSRSSDRSTTGPQSIHAVDVLPDTKSYQRHELLTISWLWWLGLPLIAWWWVVLAAAAVKRLSGAKKTSFGTVG